MYEKTNSCIATFHALNSIEPIIFFCKTSVPTLYVYMFTHPVHRRGNNPRPKYTYYSCNYSLGQYNRTEHNF